MIRFKIMAVVSLVGAIYCQYLDEKALQAPLKVVEYSTSKAIIL